MKLSRIPIYYVIILFLVGFIAFTFFNERLVYQNAQAQLLKHGTIVSNALWNLDSQSPIRYLEEACINNNYKSLTLKDDLGSKFIHIETDTLNAPNNILLALLPKITLKSVVNYNNQKIGTLSVVWQSKSIYLYINIFIISSLIIIALKLYIAVLYTNANLESIVFERTSELEQTNIDLANHKEHLEELVEERTKELFSTQQQAIENAHRAGMADIANGVLHNIGNILNSVNTSAHIIHELSHDSFHTKFQNANAILREHIDNFEDFIIHDSRGKSLLGYYLELGKLHQQNLESTELHVNRLQDKIKSTIEVIASQQAYAGSASMSEKLNIEDIVNDALNMEIAILENRGIVIHKNMNPHFARVDKTKLVHIILNLINNANDAMVNTPKSKRQLSFDLFSQDNHAYLKVSDSGCGISSVNLNNIFAHGFTTKKDGHGFGLHSCANYMTEMNGKLYVESKGVDQGATFTLVFQQDA